MATLLLFALTSLPFAHPKYSTRNNIATAASKIPQSIAMSAPLHSPAQVPPVLSQRQTTSQSSLHDAGHASHSSSPKRLSDLEKAETAEDVQGGNSTGAYRATSSGRISRIQSLTQRRAVFDHPLSHVKTTADVLVDFDGPDDPYRPINWPFRKKVITTVLYGFTTASSFPPFSSLSPARTYLEA